MWIFRSHLSAFGCVSSTVLNIFASFWTSCCIYLAKSFFFNIILSSLLCCDQLVKTEFCVQNICNICWCIRILMLQGTMFSSIPYTSWIFFFGTVPDGMNTEDLIISSGNYSKTEILLQKNGIITCFFFKFQLYNKSGDLMIIKIKCLLL